MFYLLGDQNFYFPSSDDQSYLLKSFLQTKSHHDGHLPVIVKIKSLNIPHGPAKSLLAKNTPILLLELDQLQSILAEIHSTNERRDHSHRNRLKFAKKLLTKKRFSHSSLITFTNSHETAEQSDDEFDNTRTIVRTLNENRSSSTTFCRIPLNYRGFFELLNENDQPMEPYHRLVDLLKREENDSSTNLPKSEKIPQSFVLRSTCLVYTKKTTTIDERKQSGGSGDSCYGSLSDLESQKNLLILNEQPIVLSAGQILTILSQCAARRRSISLRHSHDEQLISSSSASAWFRQKSRLLFQRRKSPPIFTYEPVLSNKQSTKLTNQTEIVLKCQTEQGEIVYIPPDTTGLFSPVRSPTSSFQSSFNSDNAEISGVFQLKYLLNNLRFPLSVRLLDNLLSFDHIFSPAMIQQQNDLTSTSSTKFRLLLPFNEQIVYACPLIISSSFKTQPIVIPIPVNTDMEVQRCLNMREICQNRLYHDLVHVCSRRLNQYRTEFSFIHFPILLNPSSLLTNRRKMPLFRKRAQSESHLEYSAWDFSSDNHRKSCETLDDHQRTKNDETSMFHRDSFQTLKQKFDQTQQQTTRRSTNYTKIKFDRPRKSSQQQDLNSDDENYREVDHIYDYIRSGDVTDDVKRIQAKEQAFNAASRQRTPKIQQRRSSIPNPISRICDSPASSHTRRFPHYLDDSRPLDSEIEDDVEDLPR